MPATARRFGVLDSFDPRQNVLGGALYLKWLLDLFGGDLQLAVAAYNAGEQAVIKAGYRIPNLAETQRYVPRVLARLPAVRG
jgi:soluble lytic murein transglycosylase-like protein